MNDLNNSFEVQSIVAVAVVGGMMYLAYLMYWPILGWIIEKIWG